jgi:hypothetical protein
MTASMVDEASLQQRTKDLRLAATPKSCSHNTNKAYIGRGWSSCSTKRIVDHRLSNNKSPYILIEYTLSGAHITRIVIGLFGRR